MYSICYWFTLEANDACLRKKEAESVIFFVSARTGLLLSRNRKKDYKASYRFSPPSYFFSIFDKCGNRRKSSFELFFPFDSLIIIIMLQLLNDSSLIFLSSPSISNLMDGSLPSPRTSPTKISELESDKPNELKIFKTRFVDFFHVFCKLKKFVKC